VATRAHGPDPLATVRDAFEGMGQLLGRRLAAPAFTAGAY
jgi:hypothetical protein